MFHIEGILFHRLNQIKNPKTYCIKFGNKLYYYTKLQLFFLSLNAYEHFETSNDTFVIEEQLQFSSLSQDLVLCFNQLDSLFHSESEILLNSQNVPNFKILEDFLGNPFLKSKCFEVTSDQTQIFKLSSKYFSFLLKKQIDKLTDFHLIVKAQQFPINFEFFCCVSDKFLQMQHSRNTFVCSIPDPHFNCFVQFMKIFQGVQFNFF